MFNFDPEVLLQGLEASAYGMGGVFIVLILFYVITKVMLWVSNKASAK